MDDKKIAEEILISHGGKDNIEAAAHCATRLRIVLKDNAKLNKMIRSRLFLLSKALANKNVLSTATPASTPIKLR
mgnify:CR=1 FL=1